MIPYFAYQRKRFFDFCLEKFYFSHTFRQESGLLLQKGTESVENAYYGYGRRAVFGRGAAAARRGAAGYRPPRRGDGDAGRDRPRGAQPPPGQVCYVGNAQRQRAGRAGRRRHRGVRPGAAGPFAAGRAGAGAGGWATAALPPMPLARARCSASLLLWARALPRRCGGCAR